MTTPKWPNGLRMFYKALRDLSEPILNGTLVTIDPSIGSKDSQPGYAVFYQGRLQVSGTVPIDHRETAYRRTRILYDAVSVLLPSPPDVLGIENLAAGWANQKTVWAVALSIAAADAVRTIECPIPFWRAYAATQPDYKKGDEADARMMGEAMVAYCREMFAEEGAA